jgi:hypothetical protein
LLNNPREQFQLFDELTRSLYSWGIDENVVDIATVKYSIKNTADDEEILKFIQNDWKEI